MAEIENPPGDIECPCLFCSEFGRLSGKIDLNHCVHRPAFFSSPPIQFFSQFKPVQRMDHIKETNGILRLIRLKMSDEVPSHRPANLLNLLLGLLNIIFSKNGTTRFTAF